MNRLLTLSDVLASHARLKPDAIGVRDSRREMSFSAWNNRASRLANGLLALGLRKGDRVAVLAFNCAEWMEIYAAMARAGLVVVPINFRLTAPEVAYILGDAEARCVIAQTALTDRVAAPGVAPDLVRISMGTEPLDGWQDYEQLIETASQQSVPVTVLPSDTSALMYTSGTTGKPKGVIRSHEGSTLIAMATALEMGFTHQDIALLVMPMCHANSLYFSHTFAHLGATCVIDDSQHFEPEKLLRTLARERITFTSLVPTHFIMMLGLPEAVKAQHDVSAVGRLMISSAPARKDTKLAILDFFKNGRLYELYGSTEAGWVTLLRPHEQLTQLGSVGREWAMSGPIRFLDADGQDVPDGEIGELFSRTAYSFDGYWKNEEKTQAAYAGNWCSVGDLGYRDSNGFIHLVDRKSNMIISGGENVYPSEVEGVLGTHPVVKDVAVIGIPDEKWGEAVHAFVVLHDETGVDSRGLVAWCRERLAGYKCPKQVTLIQDHEMPRNPTGKLLHRVLRERYAA